MPALAIRLPDHNRALAQIRRDRCVSLHGRPQQLSVPNGIVALVGPEGRVQLVGRARRIVGPIRVRLLNGDFLARGYRLELTKVKIPHRELRLQIRWRAVGQFRYFDARNWSAMIIGPPSEIGGGDYLDASEETRATSPPSIPFSGGIPGQAHGAPEAKLVREYIAWLRAEDEFAHDYLRAERLFTDLFDKRHWRLIEAKHISDRRTLRAAVGQLLDYKRWYPRKPSLGVLVGSKPSQGCRRFLAHYGIIVIWRTPSGRFTDSSEERAWSGARRVGTA
jgi:hypothetical protein